MLVPVDFHSFSPHTIEVNSAGNCLVFGWTFPLNGLLIHVENNNITKNPTHCNYKFDSHRLRSRGGTYTQKHHEKPTAISSIPVWWSPYTNIHTLKTILGLFFRQQCWSLSVPVFCTQFRRELKVNLLLSSYNYSYLTSLSALLSQTKIVKIKNTTLKYIIFTFTKDTVSENLWVLWVILIAKLFLA